MAEPKFVAPPCSMLLLINTWYDASFYTCELPAENRRRNRLVRRPQESTARDRKLTSESESVVVVSYELELS